MHGANLDRYVEPGTAPMKLPSFHQREALTEARTQQRMPEQDHVTVELVDVHQAEALTGNECTVDAIVGEQLAQQVEPSLRHQCTG
jgi:hypothetical protein